jgi:hypothetical protein
MVPAMIASLLKHVMFTILYIGKSIYRSYTKKIIVIAFIGILNILSVIAWPDNEQAKFNIEHLECSRSLSEWSDCQFQVRKFTSNANNENKKCWFYFLHIPNVRNLTC